VQPKIGEAKIRHLVTQKVAPLQHHRPFSMQTILPQANLVNDGQPPSIETNQPNINHSELSISVADIRFEKEDNEKELKKEDGQKDWPNSSREESKGNNGENDGTVKFRPFATLQRPDKTKVPFYFIELI